MQYFLNGALEAQQRIISVLQSTTKGIPSDVAELQGELLEAHLQIAHMLVTNDGSEQQTLNDLGAIERIIVKLTADMEAYIGPMH